MKMPVAKVTTALGSSELFRILLRIRDIVDYAGSFGIRPQYNTRVQPITQIYQLKYFVLKHQVFSYKPLNQVEVVFRTSLDMFMNIALRSGSPHIRLIRDQVLRFREELNPQTLAWFQNNDADSLLWVAAIAAFNSEEQRHYEYFIDIVRACVQRLNVSTWEEFHKRLGKIVFFRTSIYRFYEMIWLAASEGDTGTWSPSKELVMFRMKQCEESIPDVKDPGGEKGASGYSLTIRHSPVVPHVIL